MEKEKIKNIKINKDLAKLIGTTVLVDSLIAGIFSVGGHTPIYQDDKKVNMVLETKTKELDNIHEITISSYYENEVETKNRVIYYKKPFETNNGRFREVETVYKNFYGPTKYTKIVPVNDIEDNSSYVETYQYDINTNHFIVVKETLHDEILHDTALLMMLSLIDTVIISAGKSYIKRKEEEKKDTY